MNKIHTPRYGKEIESAEELLREALREENPEERGNSVCDLARHILGPTEDEIQAGSALTGLMHQEGAVSMLEELRRILQNLLGEERDHLSEENKKKFREYVDLLDQRIQVARSTEDRVRREQRAIRRTTGSVMGGPSRVA